MANPDKRLPAIPDQVETRKDQSTVAQAASPVASLSSHVDPEPHYLASAACAGSAAYLNFRSNNPRAALAAAGFSLLYLTSGRLVITGHPRTGYDLGSATSLGLLAWTAPAATINPANAVMGTVGFMSAAANLIKSYQQRTGKPLEMIEK